ncbi:phosphoribosylanthranilate isomerase [Tenacibaculum tangerinum]|uniref:N-(5'-phosphoribosyl)anthranilate isomerase n=1 Tax=Tenacibaculum tangerinum TaxID=3038772 RepID=A0ABY8L1F8_9FLAO|nr:phosphoribosylanthranilate isomerase [Tenacibaculum tangerinum]WGH75292.1 phosphoribosylanthranilate isomerase [Tenacibaculum tangerinum]
MKLKVCGMKFIENIQQVAEVKPDYLGFIFYEKSPRNFEGIIPKLPNGVKKVGVFVNEYLEIVVSLVEEYQLEAVQLHGDESVDYIQKLKAHLPKVEIIKVFGIKDEFNFEVLAPYEEVVNYFLFDTKGKERGGNGITFNWEVLQNYNSTKPFFLSGGMGLEEIDELQLFFTGTASECCYAIDINSKFEIKPGVKSVEKIRKFKKAVITNEVT